MGHSIDGSTNANVGGIMSVDPRRTQPFCEGRCYRECRCSRWPDYKNRFGEYVVPHDEDQEYYEKVLGYGPIVYWPLWETAGAVADNLGTLGAAADGTYVGVTLNNAIGPDGVNGCPFFDGANDFVNIFSAAFNAAFNGATGTVVIWARVNAAAVWADGAQRYAFHIYDDATNYYKVQKVGAASTIQFQGVAGGGNATTNVNPFSDTAWFHIAITWSDGANADQFISYINGVQQGGASPNLNIWAGGGLSNIRTLIGAQITTPSLVWHGWLAHCAVWTSVLTPAQILDIATID